MSKCKCPDCGRTVSSHAVSCPHCGCPGSRMKSRAGYENFIGLIIFAIIIIALVKGKQDEDNKSQTGTGENTIESVTSEINETSNIRSINDDEYLKNSHVNEDELISDNEIIESPDFNQEEISEIIVNENIENNIDITEN